ncbi:MAG: 3-isopropylmalate dehydrogenase, partial [Pseudomonadota bacterium]
MTNTLLILPGDGIGPEVMAEVRKIIGWFSARGLPFAIEEDLVGGIAYDTHGTPLTDATMAKAQAADAVLLGAVGGPKWDDLDFSVKPERGLLRLRKEMDLYANLRPAQCFDALADFSSLKPDIVAGLDILIIRELTSGVYFGEPRGIVKEGNERVGINTHRYTETEIARVARSAFELARRRANKVCSMEKRNVMEAGILWHDVVAEVHKAEYPDVELSHMLADAGGMQLVRWPKQFDVILTDNLFGDMLSDAAAMLTGSLGMLPSA